VVGCGQTKAPCNWTLCVTWYLRDACVKLVLPKTNSKPRVQKQVPCWMCPGSCHNWVVTTDAPPCDLTTTAWEAQKILPKVVQHLVLKCFGSVWLTANPSHT
jgi:hypothetical protein